MIGCLDGDFCFHVLVLLCVWVGGLRGLVLNLGYLCVYCFGLFLFVGYWFGVLFVVGWWLLVRFCSNFVGDELGLRFGRFCDIVVW